jgi:NADH-quinone oxidoreductase subunit N
VFSLGGIPFAAGFFSKLFVFMAAMEQGHTLLVFLAFLNTVISLYYYLLVVKAMFIKKSSSPIEPLTTDGYMKTSLAISLAGIFLTGIASCFYQYISEMSFGIY